MLERVPEAVSRSEELAFYRRNGEVQNAGNFIVGHALVSSKDHGKALFFWEVGNRLINGMLKFGVEHSLIGGGRLKVGGL